MSVAWSQTFDDQTPGQPPSGWANFTLSGTPSPIVEVSQIDSVSAPNSYRLRRAWSWNVAVMDQPLFPEWNQASPKRLEAWIRKGPEAVFMLDGVIGGIGLSQEIGAEASLVAGLALGEEVLKPGGPNLIRVWNGSSWVSEDGVLWSRFQEWEKFKLYVDFGAQSLVWKVSGNPWKTSPLVGEVSEIRQIFLFSQGAASILADDLVLRPGPFRVPSRPWNIGRSSL